MAEVANGDYWKLHQELLALVGDLHREGHLNKHAFDLLTMAIASGSYDAGIGYLVAAGIIPHDVRRKESPAPPVKA